ncbi:MAG: hypothetical protein L3J89_02380 [Gammaproteobacteria bacterium]|nr:hypothetical protein [Gammaproteobacteria bacterium]
MTTVFNKIHRLKQRPGWTWGHFLTEIDKCSSMGVDEKTLYSHFREPHKKPNSQLEKLINQLHDGYFPDPFPEALNRLMRLYNHLFNCKKHIAKEKDIQDLEFFLQQQCEREVEWLRISRLNWLLGNIAFDRIPLYRDNGMREQLESCKQSAISHYQKSVSAIEFHNEKYPQAMVGTSHLYKARHNILACYLNAVPQAKRGKDENIIRYLKASSYIANSKRALEAEPFQWTIARNGLRFSSLLENDADVIYFITALANISRRFLNLDYEPLNHGAINEGEDFHWAIENVLTSDYLASIEMDMKKNNKGKRS